MRDRDGDGRDGGGQRKQHSGNAWSKGRPRISSSDGPPQMKKFEEPQVPVSVELRHFTHVNPTWLDVGISQCFDVGYKPLPYT